MNKTIIFLFFFVSLSCSENKTENKKVFVVKNIFAIPDNVSEESLVLYGFKNTINNQNQIKDVSTKEYNKHHPQYRFSNKKVKVCAMFSHGKLNQLDYVIDTNTWKKLDKKILNFNEKKLIRVGNKNKKLILKQKHVIISGQIFRYELPLSKEDIANAGCYQNPITKKKTYNYSPYQLYTVSLTKVFQIKIRNNRVKYCY